MAPRIHDADLCERIRKLEERVKELEARPPVIAYPPVYVYPYWHTAHHCYPGCVHNTTISTSGTTWQPDSPTIIYSPGPQSTYTLTGGVPD